MPNKYKLVALDMDGTAYNFMGGVVEQNVEPIIAAQEKGVKVVFVTGRPLNARDNKFVENGFTKHEAIAVGYNGAMVYDFHENKQLHASPINRELAIAGFKESYKHKANENVIWAYSVDETKVFLSRDITGTRLEVELSFFDGEALVLGPDEVEEKMTDCYKFLVTNCTDDYISYLENNGFEVAYSPNSANAEVNVKGTNKKTGVQFICDRYGIKAEEVIAMGDGKNDVPMLEYVGLAIVPSNANEVVKEIADEVLPISNTEGAVAFVLNRHFLNEGEN